MERGLKAIARVQRFLGVLLLATAAAGCVSFERTALTAFANLARPAPTELPAEYRYEKRSVAPVLARAPARDSEWYESYAFALPSLGENGQPGNFVTGEYLASKERGKKKLVVIVPIYGSSPIPSENLALHLTAWNWRAGTNVLVLHGEGDLFDWERMANAATAEEFLREVNASARRIITTVNDIRRLIDWAETRPEIDPGRIGIAGFSISATIGSIVMGMDARVAAGVFVMGGGNLHEVFARGASPDIVAAREHLMHVFGWTVEEIEARLEPRLRAVNPVHFAGAIDPSRVLVVDSLYDDFIPRKAQDDLWNAMGRPERVSMKYTHKRSFIMSFIGFHFADRLTSKFFKKKL